MDKNKVAIAMDVSRFPVLYLNFLDFIERSPELGFINFLGTKLFTESDELPDILGLCAQHNIQVQFSNLALMSPDVLPLLVTCGIVVRVVFPQEQEAELKPMIDELIRLRELHKSAIPEIVCIVPDEKIEQKVAPARNVSRNKTLPLSENKTVASKPERKASQPPKSNSFGFYDFIDGLEELPCGRLLNYPLINFDGRFIGCWENFQDTPINAFEIGIAAAINHKFVKRMCKMLYTGHLDVDIPCMRCPIFTDLVWHNKRVRLIK